MATYAYTAQDSTTTVTQGGMVSSTITDQFGRVIVQNAADGTSTKMGYDGAGRLVSKRNVSTTLRQKAA